jgi:hypothetical protein
MSDFYFEHFNAITWALFEWPTIFSVIATALVATIAGRTEC